MATNFDFTDKTQQSITDAIQLANDYANAQGPFFLSFSFIDLSQTSSSDQYTLPILLSSLSISPHIYLPLHLELLCSPLSYREQVAIP